ncbi:probable methyltransferase-like protein 25 [Lineus longissimus]|uniref:probable methyltransferase-like protein 25 n=1 Tax=Lineus longissimus TaxID=88925 RepID=UPI002B4F49CA
MTDVKSPRGELVKRSLNKTLSVLEPYLSLLNAHNTDFISHSHWENFIDKNIAEEVLKLTNDELIRLPSGTIFQRPSSSDNSSRDSARTSELVTLAARTPRWPHEHLEDFLTSIAACTLPNLGIEISLETLIESCLIPLEGNAVSIHHYMSKKKCHEVDIMAEICARLARYMDINEVVDVGSGKGYLSSRMALMYGLKVIGVDASQSFTNSANKRNENLGKRWDEFVKTAKAKVTENENQSPKCLRSVGDFASSSACDQDIGCDKNPHSGSRDTSEDKKIAVGVTEISDKMEHLNATPSMDHGAKNQPKIIDSDGLLDKMSSGCECGETGGDPSLCAFCKDMLLSRRDIPENSGACSETRPGVYIPLTQFIDSKTDLKSLVKEHLGSSAGNGQVLLTGLHTCGNLAPSMLRIFSENDAVGSICNVGCCYQHVEEEFFPNPFLHVGGDDPVPNESGFPMSSYLTGRQVKLGRNARMLASQPMDRIAAGGINSQKSLYWRAILQQILIDLTGTVRKDWQIGKICKKCPTFNVYVRKALKKLGMQDQYKITDAKIQEYLMKFPAEEKKVFAFFQLRACFGPVVEAVVLMDRLLFLLEQDHISQAYLTRLFDPVLSPRCYAILGIKN